MIGLQLVEARSLAMQEACLESPGAMVTVIGLQETTLQSIIASVVEEEALEPTSLYPSSDNETTSSFESAPSEATSGEPAPAPSKATSGEPAPSHSKATSPWAERVLCVGNYLFPSGMVVSGDLKLVEEVKRHAENAGASSVKPVRVSGAFHSKLMAPAVHKLKAILETIHFEMPLFPVYSNVTGLPYGNVEEIRTGLALQVTHPVLWDRTMVHMIGEHVEVVKEGEVKRMNSGVKLIEMGPGKQLRGILKRISRSTYRQSEGQTV